jgi:anti-anti-sigma factor
MSDLDATPHVRLALHGAIDSSNARTGLDLVMRADALPGDAVTLDLSDVDFIDSSGISMLLKIRSYLDDMGCRFVLVNPSAQVVRVLTIVGLNEMFAVDDA